MAEIDDSSEPLTLRIDLPAPLAVKLLSELLAHGSPSESERLACARNILSARRRREKVFPSVRFGEPSWDMVLDLFVATAEGRRVDVTGLCLASGVAPTTAVRYVEMLIENGSITKVADENDGRRCFVTMTTGFRDTMDRWLDGELVAMRLASLVGLKP